MHEHHKEIAVLYHGGCPDGFGGAYAAWKKFGDTAEYIPVSHGDAPPLGLEGREIYLIDFCYESNEEMQAILTHAKKFVVLEHHESVRELVQNIPEHVFDLSRSGATIAWQYFHPETATPRLMTYLEDGDLYRYALPETRDIFSYFFVLPNEFEAWDQLASNLEDDTQRTAILTEAHAYTTFFTALAHASVERAKKVRFEGHDVYFAVTHPMMTMKSFVGHELYTKLPPFALVVTAHPDGFGVSIRGDGSVDVSKIAAKYGGGGHPGSSGFFIPNGTSMPWTKIEDENPSD